MRRAPRLLQGNRAHELAFAGNHRTYFSDLYQFLLTTPWPRLLTTLGLVYLAINVLFALAYLLDPASIENARPGSFADAFFFSVQTMATIGYGKMVPRTLYANLLVTLEVLVGLFGIAMVTGLMFAKFSRPTARVLFSRMAIIAPRDAVTSLMFRMANSRGNNIVEAHVHVVLARNEVTVEGESLRRFYDLELVRGQSALFALSWTAIHPITARSPLQGATPASLAASGAEIIVSLLGFDETFSQTVHARHRYGPADIAWGARFVDILSRLPDGRQRIDYARFHDVVSDGAAPEVHAE
jgi:inward rectifier potassium channel